MTKQSLAKVSIVTIILFAIFLVFKFDLTQYLTLEQLKLQQEKLATINETQPVKTALLFFIVYIAAAALSIPGAVILTLAGGAIFGLIKGTIIISFASTIGATLAFLMARFLLGNTIEKKFSSHLSKINNGIEKDGAFYLFGLRLVPAFPFFVINLVMGLTRFKTTTFAWVSQIGMLPATIVYVNAGQQLSSIGSLKEILSFKLIISFVILGIFPFIAKKALDHLKKIKQH